MRRRTQPPLVTMAVLAGCVPAAVLPSCPASTAASSATYVLARAGALTITAPAAVSLGSGTSGSQRSAQMGTVTVTDTRAPGAGAWTATVSSTDYTRTTPPVATIGRANMSYWSGQATATQGNGPFVPGQPTAAARVTLAVPRTAFSRTAQGGVNSASWNPTLVLSIPFAGVTAGTYTGVVTHSVA
ncbi:hypothetical protein GCM10009677_56680 [Sphaerisporangium rubeum]|uniref:WxL domain-containing protein n=1 Tax=Sphaerisporangium rubeum TaxID=321317 RepID=A0A7X0M5U4_9ACTN|nr:hypothetical protein [Sphaerisporangium rubeum]MBB6473043.1 hypothetical protein [Sphaerisporangium rubeum]